jgi:hypothetical protein
LGCRRWDSTCSSTSPSNLQSTNVPFRTTPARKRIVITTLYLQRRYEDDLNWCKSVYDSGNGKLGFGSLKHWAQPHLPASNASVSSTTSEKHGWSTRNNEEIEEKYGGPSGSDEVVQIRKELQDRFDESRMLQGDNHFRFEGTSVLLSSSYVLHVYDKICDMTGSTLLQMLKMFNDLVERPSDRDVDDSELVEDYLQKVGVFKQLVHEYLNLFFHVIDSGRYRLF